MPATRNTFRTIWFDCGSGATGYAFFSIDGVAFTSYKHNVMDHIIMWKTGELTGTENEIAHKALKLCYQARFSPYPFISNLVIGLESFQIRQTIGGDELLSPVRINAKIDYGCILNGCPEPIYQSPSLRTGVTKDRLKRWGFHWKGKDSFAAMQHAIVYLRRLKKETDQRPWILKED